MTLCLIIIKVQYKKAGNIISAYTTSSSQNGWTWAIVPTPLSVDWKLHTRDWIATKQFRYDGFHL